MSENPETPTCPSCGEPMEVWPALEGEGYVSACPRCPQVPPQTTSSRQEHRTGVDGARERFRGLLKSDDASNDPQTIPEELLQDLPEEARRLLRADRRDEASSQSAPLREEWMRSLRDQGYLIDEDAHGVRLGGAPRSSSSGLSPYEIVHLAADLEGGVPPPEKRRRCPHCDAVVASGLERCPWCGETIEAEGPTPE